MTARNTGNPDIDMRGKMTGGKFLAIMVGAFSIIVGVNLVMAWQAIGTFPGLEVANGYVASQSFDRDRAAQERLGWTTSARDEDGTLVIEITGPDGQPADVAEIRALIGRATTAAQDVTPQLSFAGGAWRAPLQLGSGRWILNLHAKAADGTPYRLRIPLHVIRKAEAG